MRLFTTILRDRECLSHVTSNFTAIIPSRSIRQMLAIFSGIEVQEKEKKFVVLSLRPPLKVKLGIFTT